METMMRRSFGERFIGAMRLDTSVYEEVEADTTATGQAALVVAIVAVASAIGGAEDGGWLGGLLSAFIGWAIWSGVTYVIGAKLLGGTATWGEMLRTIGFAMSPGVINVLGIIPLLGWLAMGVAFVWSLIAGVIAIRQALDFGTGRALLTALLGLIPYVVVTSILMFFLGR